jgi:hypothetical protein
LRESPESLPIQMVNLVQHQMLFRRKNKKETNQLVRLPDWDQKPS